jgi:hypothetical protein
MDIDIAASVVILRPKAEVAEFAADPDNTPKWQTHLKLVERDPMGPLSVGTHFAFSSRFIRWDTRYTYEVMKYVPGEVLVLRTAGDDASLYSTEATYTWESLGPSETKMMLRHRGTTSATATWITSPLMHLITRLGVQRDLRRLKRLLEK